MKNVTWSFVFALLIVLQGSVNAQSVKRTMWRWPDTDQKNSYTNTFGEDNDYQINLPAYKNNGNGTITDTVTTLIWQQSDGGEMTVENAQVYCDTLTLGGFTDWRMPTAMELFSILNHQMNNPAINTAYFANTGAEYWWSSEHQSNDATKIWCTNAGGGVGNHPKAETISAGGTKKFHVKAVRDATIPVVIPARYTDNGDSTITDNYTNLVWQKFPSSNAQTWEQAIISSENLVLANQSDWRLPNIKELQSLTDVSIAAPALTKPFF